MEETHTTGLEIAVVGLAGRFPESPDVAALWEKLAAGVECISFFTDEELLAENPGLSPELLANPAYVKARGVLDGADLFDADFFGYNPREASILDPQQRLFLECAWEALEDAGYDPRRHRALTGVWGGASTPTYFFNIVSHPDLVQSLGSLQLTLGTEKDFLANRVAYKLGLEGPAVTVQTACSTSLVAVHAACQALLSGECDMALAGGVSVTFPQRNGYLYRTGAILSPDGHCRPFDAQAGGTVGGHGVGIVVLKRLADALAARDSIRAVIRGSAVNNDGAGRAGFTTPRVEGQARVIRAALEIAEVEAASIGYVEGHGTATELGDPVEFTALSEAYGDEPARQATALGSIKGNIGHLDAAAGVAGLIKAVLALEQGQVPASLHFEAPNPEIDLAASPFYVNTALSPWPEREGPRRAAVSSFGLGGTNAHVVLEEAPPAPVAAAGRPAQLLLLAARSAPALDAATRRLADHLDRHPEQELADVAYTTQVGRTAFLHRRFLVAREREEAARALAALDPARVLSAVYDEGSARQVAFLFPGLGEHHPGQGRALYEAEPVFRAEIDRAAEILQPILGRDLREVLFAGGAEAPAGPAGLDLRRMLGRGSAAEAGDLARPSLAQPALFALEVALARLWMSWGIRPQAMLGYSLGEYAAAAVAGVFSFEDGLRLVAHRGGLLETLPPGAMLAVSLPEGELAPLLAASPALAVAAVNGPELAVVAGAEEEIADLEARLTARGAASRRLDTAHAFHSPALAALADPLRRLFAEVELKAPEIPYLSNRTGDWITAAEATDPEAWIAQMCGTVRFGDGVARLWEEPGRLLLELGPGRSLGSLALQHPAGGGPRIALPTLPHRFERQDEPELALRTLGSLWLAGVEVDWPAFQEGEERRRVPLPTYPFERQRYWIEARPGGVPGEAAPPPRATKLADMAEWFHAPTFERAAPRLGRAEAPVAGRWLLFADERGAGAALAACLAERGAAQVMMVAVRVGGPFERAGDGSFLLDPARPEHYDALLSAIGGAPEEIVHLWTLDGEGTEPVPAGSQERGFWSLLHLAQRLGARRCRLSLVTRGLLAVERGDPLVPGHATLQGPFVVIPQELPGVRCRLIDVDPGEVSTAAGADALLAELALDDAEPLVARRGRHRWVPSFEPVRLPAPPTPPVALRPGGVYLITGGLGGVGLGVAHYLARRVGAKLALLGRTGVPERGEWEARSTAGDALGERLRRLLEIEAAGGEVLPIAADVADEAAMREAVRRCRERFGALHGVIHAAAVPGGGLLQLKDPAMAAAVLAPKVAGTLALAAALEAEGVTLDFLALFSSLSAHWGGVGQVDYAAANAFLGAYAQWAAGQGLPVVAIDWCEWQWDAWSEQGLAVLGEEVHARLAQGRARTGLTFDEGAEAFERALESGLPQVLVSTRDLSAHAHHDTSVAQVLGQLATLHEGESRHPRPVLGVAYQAPESPEEKAIVDIWQELLGLEEVGVHDNFFELGGHSLLATQVMSRLAERFAVTLPLRAIFEAPTAATLAALLSQKPAEAAAAEAIPTRARPAGPASAVEDLSDREVDALLADLLADMEGS